MTPESVRPDIMRHAIELTRQSDPQPDADDETLALFIDRGIDAVNPTERAALLRAIGNSPEVAAVVANLAPSASEWTLAPRRAGILGVPAGVWRLAWAACLLCALGVTMWHLASPTESSGVKLLDGGVDGPSQDFADSLHSTIRRSTVFLLWVSLALLTIPAFLSGPRQAARARADA